MSMKSSFSESSFPPSHEYVIGLKQKETNITPSLKIWITWERQNKFCKRCPLFHTKPGMEDLHLPKSKLTHFSTGRTLDSSPHKCTKCSDGTKHVWNVPMSFPLLPCMCFPSLFQIPKLLFSYLPLHLPHQGVRYSSNHFKKKNICQALLLIVQNCKEASTEVKKKLQQQIADIYIYHTIGWMRRLCRDAGETVRTDQRLLLNWWIGEVAIVLLWTRKI